MPKSVFGGAHQEMVAVLIDARKSSGLTQAELGLRVGKDQTFVSLIENSQRRVDLLRVHRPVPCVKIDPKVVFGLILERVPAKFDI
jgi:transcriptional regulator with XRE-family HTH domain